MKQKRPISLFLDESAKLLSENIELNEEILRECEVELVLAFQNEFLLKRGSHRVMNFRNHAKKQVFR